MRTVENACATLLQCERETFHQSLLARVAEDERLAIDARCCDLLADCIADASRIEHETRFAASADDTQQMLDECAVG